MIQYSLPTVINIAGKDYKIRWDYRAALDIITALGDPNLDNTDKAEAVLRILYIDYERIPLQHLEEALTKAYQFLDGGKEPSKDKRKNPRLVDWEKDFSLIVAPVNRVLGYDIRQQKELHWWTFLGAYMEIGGDCTFSQVVNIRDKKARNKKLEKYEREWERRNRDLIDLPERRTEEQNDWLRSWGVKVKSDG